LTCTLIGNRYTSSGSFAGVAVSSTVCATNRFVISSTDDFLWDTGSLRDYHNTSGFSIACVAVRLPVLAADWRELHGADNGFVTSSSIEFLNTETLSFAGVAVRYAVIAANGIVLFRAEYFRWRHARSLVCDFDFFNQGIARVAVVYAIFTANWIENCGADHVDASGRSGNK